MSSWAEPQLRAVTCGCACGCKVQVDAGAAEVLTNQEHRHVCAGCWEDHVPVAAPYGVPQRAVRMAHRVVETVANGPARWERLAVMVRATDGGQAWRNAQADLARWLLTRDGRESDAYQVVSAHDGSPDGLWLVVVDAFWRGPA
jgi:hypothetical protein